MNQTCPSSGNLYATSLTNCTISIKKNMFSFKNIAYIGQPPGSNRSSVASEELYMLFFPLEISLQLSQPELISRTDTKSLGTFFYSTHESLNSTVDTAKSSLLNRFW